MNTWIMAFDYGNVRIGIAIANTQLKIPHPITTVTGRNNLEKLTKISKLIEEWSPSLLVIGMPPLDNIDQIQKQLLIKNINKFTNRLKAKFKLPVTLINEDYTSQIASEQLQTQNLYGKAQALKIDSLAACLILQFFFNQ